MLSKNPINDVIVLASASLRRIELLRNAGFNFVIDPANIQERLGRDEPPEKLVCRLAGEKAKKVSERHPQKIILGADTIVFFENRIIGKPTDLADARKILQELKGNTHHVYTGVCLTHRSANKTIKWFAVAKVTFRRFSDEELNACLSTGQPLDKAGGYAFQEHEETLVSHYSGLRNTVIGLPLEEVLVQLREFHVTHGHS